MRTQYRERSQHSALSPARPEASWHAYASLRTHALSCVIPHLVTICHCHPWHVTPRQTDLTPMPSLTPGWEAVVIWIEITGRGWLISLWHNSNTTQKERSAVFKGFFFFFSKLPPPPSPLLCIWVFNYSLGSCFYFWRIKSCVLITCIFN